MASPDNEVLHAGNLSIYTGFYHGEYHNGGCPDCPQDVEYVLYEPILLSDQEVAQGYGLIDGTPTTWEERKPAVKPKVVTREQVVQMRKSPIPPEGIIFPGMV